MVRSKLFLSVDNSKCLVRREVPVCVSDKIILYDNIELEILQLLTKDTQNHLNFLHIHFPYFSITHFNIALVRPSRIFRYSLTTKLFDVILT